MRKSPSFVLLWVLLLTFSVSAQNYSRLEDLAGDLKKQAEDLVDKTSGDLDRRSSNSHDEIERAFLAEQFLASAKLIKKMIDDKFPLNDLREAGAVMTDLTRNFPDFGPDGSDWKQARDRVDALNFELRGSNQPPDDDGPDDVPSDSNILGKVFWNGEVDAEVHLEINGANLEVRTIAGKAYPPGTHSFTSMLPRRDGLRVGVKKNEGRGDVRVLQQPDSGNDYTAIIQIVDPKGAADRYVLEIYWQ